MKSSVVTMRFRYIWWWLWCCFCVVLFLCGV